MSLSATEAVLVGLLTRTLRVLALGTLSGVIVTLAGRVSSSRTLTMTESPGVSPLMPKLTSEHLLAAIAVNPIVPLPLAPGLRKAGEWRPSSLSAQPALPVLARKCPEAWQRTALAPSP